jgi:hypothetical protein
MQRRHLLVLLLATLLEAGLLGLAGPWAYRQLQRNACLRTGRCWDVARSRCSQVQEGCPSSQ